MADKNTTIPKGWKETTLEAVTDKIGDGLHGTPQYSNEGEYYFVNGNNIENGRVKIKSDTGRVDEIEFIKYKKDLGQNTILLSINGTIGNLAKYNNEKCILGKSAAYINVNNETSLDFIYYVMLDSKFQRDILKNANGSTIKNVSLAQLRNYNFCIPEFLEQRAIAAVLSSLDDKIELLREQNKTLEATAQAIFKEWFVNFNFPGATGKMIDSELGEIPEGWKIGTVNYFIKRETLSYRCDQDDLSAKGKTPIIDQGTGGLYGYTEREPDFQASKENPVILFTNHTCNMWFVNYPFCAIQNVIPFRGNSEYDIFFVFYMTLGRVSFIEYKGHWPDFEQKEYVIPTSDIANKFAETVKPLQYKIWNNNSQTQILSTLRDTLLPKLMKGEIRVKGFKN